MNEQSLMLLRAIRGPVIMITVGVLFAFDKFSSFRFSQTWPVLLIVIGVLSLGGSGRHRRGFGGPPPPPPANPSGQV